MPAVKKWQQSVWLCWIFLWTVLMNNNHLGVLDCVALNELQFKGSVHELPTKFVNRSSGVLRQKSGFKCKEQKTCRQYQKNKSYLKWSASSWLNDRIFTRVTLSFLCLSSLFFLSFFLFVSFFTWKSLIQIQFSRIQLSIKRRMEEIIGHRKDHTLEYFPQYSIHRLSTFIPSLFFSFVHFCLK